jgi:hypothetical protein
MRGVVEDTAVNKAEGVSETSRCGVGLVKSDWPKLRELFSLFASFQPPSLSVLERCVNN